MTICENPALASFLTDLEPKREGSRTIRKQQSGMNGLDETHQSIGSYPP